MNNTTTHPTTEATETRVRIFWAEANDSTVVKRTNKQAVGDDFSFAMIDTSEDNAEGNFNGYFAYQPHEAILDEVYERQGNNAEGRKLFPCQYSLSIGDVIEIEEDRKGRDHYVDASDITVYIVARIGFVKLQVNENDGNFKVWRDSTYQERIMMGRKLSKGF